MSEPFRAEEFRVFLLRAAESGNARIVALIGAVALVVAVLALVRRRALAEEYTPIWIAVAFGVLAVSVSMDLLVAITRALGAWTPSSAIFFLGQVFLVGICLNFAVRLSRMSRQLRTLAQEIALLRRSDESAGEAARGE